MGDRPLAYDTAPGGGVPLVDALPPPPKRPSEKLPPGEWVKKNLFNTVANSILTLVLGAVSAYVLYRIFFLLFVNIDWEIVRVNLDLAMEGRYPRDDLWRPATSFILTLAAVGLGSGLVAASSIDRADEAGLEANVSSLRELAVRFWPFIGIAVLVLSFSRTWTPALVMLAATAALIAGRLLMLHAPASIRQWGWPITLFVAIISFKVMTDTSEALSFGVGEIIFWSLVVAALGFTKRWRGLVYVAVIVVAWHLPMGEGGADLEDIGGLHLNFYLTVFGIGLAFPVGLLLALGRRSSLPVVRVVSVGYIELVRGVPMIAWLFMASFFLGFFLPENLEQPSLAARAVVVIAIFSSAYLAEIIRGGLQAVPKGQTEAGQALGMGPGGVTRLIVMPQALRAVIPAIVGQFISLFKDTTLVSVIGMSELLHFSDLSNNQPEFRTQFLAIVTLIFAGSIFWAGSYTMSRESRRIERNLGIGERQ